MEIVLEIPDDIAPYLQTAGSSLSLQQLSRSVLEAFALQAFKEGRLTAPQLRRLLGFSTRYQLDGFLKQHEVWLDYTGEDLRRDIETHRQLGLG